VRAALVRIGLSLVATIVGLGVASLVFALHAWGVWGSMADVGVVLSWAALFGLAGWALFVVPLILVVPDDSVLVRWPAFSIVGLVVGLVAFWLLVGWWLPLWQESVAYLVHPALTGGVVGAVYPWLVSRRESPTGTFQG